MPTATGDYHPPTPSYLTRYVVFPFYDWIVEFFPRSWTPNAITLFGIFCTVLSSALLLLSIPKNEDFDSGSVRFWPMSFFAEYLHLIPVKGALYHVLTPAFNIQKEVLLGVCGFLNLLYCIADNTDGRQARRTKQVSDTGEYLDHGLDCVTSLLSTYLVMSLWGISFSNAASGVAIVALVTTLSHVMHHEQNVMIWGNSFFTVDEGMLLFSFGLWIPVCFNAWPRATLPLIVTEALPFLAKVHVCDVILAILIVGQAQVFYSIAKRDFSVVCRPVVILMFVNVLIMTTLVSHHSISIPLESFHFLSYPSLWCLTFACTSSILGHIPIAAKCLKNEELDLTPVAGLVFIWIFFAAAPQLGTLLAVGFHVWQIAANVFFIRRTKAQRRHQRRSE